MNAAATLVEPVHPGRVADQWDAFRSSRTRTQRRTSDRFDSVGRYGRIGAR